MDDCPHSEIPSEPNSAFSYPGVSWYHPGLLFRMKQPRTVLLFCTDWFLLLNVSPFNFIKFPKQRPKTWLVWEKNGQASGDVGSTCTPIQFHSLYCSPPGRVSGEHPPQSHRSRSPSLLHTQGWDGSHGAGADVNI